MKTNLTLGLALAGALALSPLAHAERGDSDSRRAHHEKRVQQMQDQFGVTDEQLSQMREIRRNGGSREEAHAVLSDDQREQMRAWREQNPRGGKHHGGGKTRHQAE